MSETISGLWIGKNLSLMEQLSIKSFLANGHQYCLYTYGPVKDVPKGTIIKDANEILPKKRIFQYAQGFAKGSYGAFSDLFRFKLILDKGGIWADLDLVCLKPFDFKEKYVFSSENRPDGSIKTNTGVIKAPPKSKLIKSCYELAAKIKPGDIKYAQIGPDLFFSQVKKFHMDKYVRSPAAFCPLDYWDFKKALDENSTFRIPKEAYAVHLWNEKWTQEIDNKNRVLEIMYKLSAGLRRKCVFYSDWLDLLKKQLSPSGNIAGKMRGLKRPKKDRVYSRKTLYGALQHRYLFQ